MTIEIKCYVCKTVAQSDEYDYGDKKRVTCPQCGKYEISKSLLAATDDFNKVKPHILSAFIRKQNDMGITPVLYNYDMDKIAAYPEMPLVEKIDTLLLAFAESLENYNQDIDVSNKKYIAKICAKNEAEYQYIYSRVLTERGYLFSKDSQRYRISVEGWIYAESLKQKVNSTQGFVAMWFDASMTQIWEAAIEPAFEGTNFKPLRIDRKEHNEKIDDQIIAEIQRSRFVVADFTGHRGGVYFEAGYALGRGIPVIWTCREDELQKLHFDIRQYNTIAWKDAKDLKERLHQRIRATICEKN